MQCYNMICSYIIGGLCVILGDTNIKLCFMFHVCVYFVFGHVHNKYEASLWTLDNWGKY